MVVVSDYFNIDIFNWFHIRVLGKLTLHWNLYDSQTDEGKTQDDPVVEVALRHKHIR